MKCLAIDTSAHLSAVCIFDADTQTVMSELVQDIGRGHAEILISQIETCLENSQLDFKDLERIVVSCGPGSFTGVRVGMACARGLSLGLGIPAVGVTTLESCEEAARTQGADAALLTVLDAKRGQLYCKQSDSPNIWISETEAVFEMISGTTTALCGSGADLIAARTSENPIIVHTLATAPIELYARLGSTKDAVETRPEPVYLRSADAKPQTGFALERR